MRIFLILSLLIQTVFLSDVLSQNESSYVVCLETGSSLLPVYLTAMQTKGASISEDFKNEVNKILRFDLSHSGLIEVAPQKNALEKWAASLEEGKKIVFKEREESLFYFIVPVMDENTLSAIIYSISGGWIKKLSISDLKHNLEEDRRKIHMLSDEILKVLFGKTGISGTKILYTVKKTSDQGEWNSDIFEIDYDGGLPRKILSGEGYIVTPQYIPAAKGKKVGSMVYATYKNGIPKIYFANLSDGRTTRFSKLKGNQLMPTVNREKNLMAFISDATGNPDLFIASLTDLSSKPIQLFSSKMGVQGSPSFSPDGKKVAFVSNKDGTARIYIAEMPNSEDFKIEQTPQMLTKFRRSCTAPSWSPDGQKVAYCSPVDGVHQIFCYDLKTKEEQQLTSGSGEKQNPSFAPNSLHLVYNCTKGHESDLYVIDLNRKKPIKITSGPGEKRFPHWEPRN